MVRKKLQIKKKRKNKWLGLPFLGAHTKMAHLRLKLDLHSAFYSINNTLKIFSYLKDPIPADEKYGVYKLKCGSSTITYIGETGRKLKERMHYHKRQ